MRMGRAMPQSSRSRSQRRGRSRSRSRRRAASHSRSGGGVLNGHRSRSHRKDSRDRRGSRSPRRCHRASRGKSDRSASRRPHRSPTRRRSNDCPRSPSPEQQDRRKKSPSSSCSAGLHAKNETEVEQADHKKGRQKDEESAHGIGEEIAPVTEIVDGVPRVNGDLTWQAQIYVPRPGVVHRPGQKPVTVCIRGPSRPSKKDAEDDAKRLENAYSDGGIKEVRKLRSHLNSDAGRGGWGM